MQTNVLNFKKTRDFGDLLSDTFVFLKQEYKFLFRVILKYAGPFVLITAIIGSWALSGIFSIFAKAIISNSEQAFTDLLLKLGIFSISLFVSNTILICTTYSYIKLYVEKGKDGFVEEEVWQIVLKKFWSTLGTFIAIFVLVFIGMLLCYIPGIYISVATVLVLSSLVLEDLSMTDSFGRSMFLIRDNWWFTFGVTIVISLLVGFCSYIFIIPSYILGIFVAISSANNNSSDLLNIIFTIMAAISICGISLLYAVPHITNSLLYYSQVEKKESPDLINKIDQINQEVSNKDEKPLY